MNGSQYDLSLYDYDLPRDMIAQQPVEVRDNSRLMALNRKTGAVRHGVFREIGGFLRKGDLLVVNNTRVFPARMRGLRSTGGKVEVLFLHDMGGGKWETMISCSGNPRPGEQLMLEDDRLAVRLIKRQENGWWTVSLPRGADLFALLEALGRVPLPPYIKRDRDHERDLLDKERYQTIYARETGAVAAPTAGLHFTESLLDELAQRSITAVELTLHVGVGTFKPVRAHDVRRHKMHAEYYSITEATAARILEVKERGDRVIAVGTTTCRALEAAASDKGLGAGEGWADIFIYPPYEFQVIDGLITNFHLPRSTLLILVAAFAGRENILAAYEEAKRQGYRFYSYGDAMLIV